MTTTANTHRVEPQAVALGMGLTTVVYRVVDNCGSVVLLTRNLAEAQSKANELSEPKPDE